MKKKKQQRFLQQRLDAAAKEGEGTIADAEAEVDRAAEEAAAQEASAAQQYLDQQAVSPDPAVSHPRAAIG